MMNLQLLPHYCKTDVSGRCGLNVLSLFDGMSCGQIALERAGIKVNKYYAAEIDKHAIKVTMANYPNTIQLGDVTKVFAKDLEQIDLIIGGSPCQGFSFAGKGLNFEDPRSKLFFEFVRLVNECNPKWFFLENVRMKKEHELVISQYMKVAPIEINSALLSAQNRQRLYWTNINQVPWGLFGDMITDIPQPKDKGILLKDVLETDVPDKYFLSDKMLNYLNTRKANYNNGKINYKTENDVASCINASSGSIDISENIIIDTNRKSRCFTAGGNSGGLHSQMDLIVHNTMPRSSTTGKGGSGPLSRKDGKTYCLDTGNTNAVEIVSCVKFGRTDEAKEIRKESMKNGKDYTPFQAKEITGIDYEKMNTLTTVGSKDNLVIVAQRGRQDENGKWVQQFEQNNTSKTNTITSVQKDNLLLDKSPCLHGFEHGTNGQFNRQLGTGGMIRRLTPTECERLQTVPDGYTNYVSDTQRYRMLGNGWTVDVIAYIFGYMRAELSKCAGC
jgi:DNA (cytosine-5)-methyltransferase 3A